DLDLGIISDRTNDLVATSNDLISFVYTFQNLNVGCASDASGHAAKLGFTVVYNENALQFLFRCFLCSGVHLRRSGLVLIELSLLPNRQRLNRNGERMGFG